VRQAARGHPPGSSRGRRRRRTSSSELKGSAAASTRFATGGDRSRRPAGEAGQCRVPRAVDPSYVETTAGGGSDASGRSAAPGPRTSRWPSVRSLVRTRRGRAVEAGPRLRDGAPALGASAQRSSDGNVVSGLLSPRLVRRLRFKASMTEPVIAAGTGSRISAPSRRTRPVRRPERARLLPGGSAKRQTAPQLHDGGGVRERSFNRVFHSFCG